MNLPVMRPAQGSNEFVAHPETKPTRLHEAKVVGIRRHSPAHQTRLSGNESEMVFVAIATRLGNGQDALVDALG